MTVEENIARLIYNLSGGENLATIMSSGSTKQEDIKTAIGTTNGKIDTINTNLTNVKTSLDKLIQIFEIVYHDTLEAESSYTFVNP